MIFKLLSLIVTKKKKIKSNSKNITKLRNENISFKSEIESLKIQSNTFSQNLHSNTIKITNVPKKRDEDLFQVLSILRQVLDYEFSNNKIDYCYRLKSSKNLDSPPILLKFVSKVEKEILLNQKKMKKDLITTDIFDSSQKKRNIFISEFMTPHTLYQKANQLRIRGILKFVWFKNNRLFVRITDTAPAIVIKDISDIQKLDISESSETQNLALDEIVSDSSITSNTSIPTKERRGP